MEVYNKTRDDDKMEFLKIDSVQLPSHLRIFMNVRRKLALHKAYKNGFIVLFI